MKPNIGYFPAMGLAEAREKARGMLERVESGAPATAAPKKIEHPKDALTLEKALQKYEKMRLKKGEKIKSLPEAMRVMRFNFDKHLKQPLKHFDRAAMRELRDEIDARAPVMANRFLAYCGQFFKYCEDEEWITESPLHKVRKLTKEAKRERTLNEDEIAAVWKACGALETETSKVFGKLCRFLLATAQRKMEAGKLRHSSLIGGYWKMTAAETKANRDHRIKLPALALEQIGKGEPGDLVFGHKGVILQNFDRELKRLHKASGTSGWSLHDLRRTASTRMQELGISRDVITSLLNHALAGADAHYLYGALETQKSEALKSWNAELTRILSKNAGAAKA